MATIGYARVSTKEQSTDQQTDALTAAGCDRIFTEQISGTLARRPQLDAALEYARAGDVFVITRLDRLGRSVKNLSELSAYFEENGIGLKVLTQGIDTTTPGGRLFFHMLAAISEFEHDLIVERTLEGLATARARGRKGGGVFKMTPAKIAQARSMYDTKRYTVQEIADVFGVSRPTIYRYLEKDQISPPPKEPHGPRREAVDVGDLRLPH